METLTSSAYKNTSHTGNSGFPIEISIVAPCLNEEGNLAELVRRVAEVLESKHLEGELILVDDGSTDQTPVVATALMAEYPMVRLERHSRNLGIEAGWRTGIQAARGKFVCLIDADLQNPPEQIWRLYQEILFSRADIIQGARSSIGRLRDSRFLLSRGLNLILNITFGMNLKDNKSGFVLAQKDVLSDILRHRFAYYYFQSFIAVSAASKGYSIRQVETLFESRFAGKSFISGLPTKFVYRTLLDVIKGFFEFRFAIKRDNILADFLRSHQPVSTERPLSIWRRALLSVYLSCARIHTPQLSRQSKLYYEELRRSQWLRPEELKKLQDAKLRALIHHSYQHVPFYREQINKRGLGLEDIKACEDLHKLPLLTKDLVQQNLYFNLLSDNHDKKRTLRLSTVASDGQPFTLFADKHQVEINWASKLRSMEWTGYTFGDRQAALSEMPKPHSLWARFRQTLEALLSRKITFNLFRTSPTELRNFRTRISQFRPAAVHGTTESVQLLATTLANENISSVRPTSFITDGEALPEEHKRVSEDYLCSRIFNNYRCREFSAFAHECEARSGYHIDAESYIIEILKDGVLAAPGEIGEIVITDLNNYCMPLIRYRTGEFAVAMEPQHRCRCGRGLPMIGRIIKHTPFAPFIDREGCFITKGFLFDFFEDYGYLMKRIAVEQQGPGQLVLRIVKSSRFTSEEFEKALNNLRGLIKDTIVIEIEFVNDPASPKSIALCGKDRLKGHESYESKHQLTEH